MGEAGMDKLAIATVIVCAVLGGVAGWGVAPRINWVLAQAVVILAAIAAGAGAGWQWAVPWVEEEWIFRTEPTAESQILIAVDPAGAPAMKQRLRRAYADGRSQAAMAEEGIRWLEEHAQANNVLVLLRVADNTMPVRTYEQLFPLVKIAYEHDPIACYHWFSGTGHPTAEQLGFSPDQFAMARAVVDRMRAVVITRLPAALPLRAEGPGPQTLARQLRANWQVDRFDLEALDHPRQDLPDERKANGCYTMNAILSEIQRFEPGYRRYMINNAFTPTLNPDFVAPR
jgi:hypothetical protein